MKLAIALTIVLVGLGLIHAKQVQQTTDLLVEVKLLRVECAECSQCRAKLALVELGKNVEEKSRWEHWAHMEEPFPVPCHLQTPGPEGGCENQ